MARSTQSHIAKLFDTPDTRDPKGEFGPHPNSNLLMPTAEAYGDLQRPFTVLNDALFYGELPNCLITLTRRANVLGYFCAGAFRDLGGNVAHEISMNPVYLAARSEEESLSTLVHEMCHLWRHVCGRRNRKGGFGAPGYHDAVWADKMEAIGLMPSNTGGPDGHRTGFQMTHYTIGGGPFDLACRQFIGTGARIRWRDGFCQPEASPKLPPDELVPPQPQPKRRTKTRTCFVCGGCDLKVLTKASAHLACTDCNRVLVAR